MGSQIETEWLFAQRPQKSHFLQQVATRIRILSSADSNSEVTISDGTFGFLFSADNGSVVNVSGGTFGTFFDVANSTVNISGGTFNGFFDAEDGSTVIFSGGDCWQ